MALHAPHGVRLLTAGGSLALTAASQRRWLFVLTFLVGSFLLFLVQPLVARMVLPRLGGAPMVWNSAMLVYQALLLGGYAYAHWLGRFAIRRQAAIHVALLLAAAIWLPRSEEHTSELQSLMRISYAVFCLKKKKKQNID